MTGMFIFPVCYEIPDFSIQRVTLMNTDNVNFIPEMVELNFFLPDNSVGVNLYPNPCYSAVTLEIWNSLGFTPPYLVEIFSSMGVCNQSFILEDTKAIIQIESLAPGAYFVTISSKEK